MKCCSLTQIFTKQIYFFYTCNLKVGKFLPHTWQEIGIIHIPSIRLGIGQKEENYTATW